MTGGNFQQKYRIAWKFNWLREIAFCNISIGSDSIETSNRLKIYRVRLYAFIRGFYSLFGNFVPERIAYNVGWIKYRSGWSYELAADADQAFSETSAHEIGHEILSAYGGDAYSYGHRGSSSVVSQKTKTVANGGVVYPPSGDIDLMKYYNGARPRNFYIRVKASEQDVKSLLWLARIQFNE